MNRPLIIGPSEPASPYPIFAEGTVIHGFGRGGKKLGIPTANLPPEVTTDQGPLTDTPIGIYYGWSQLDGELYPMVMSLGWNPYFKNEKKSAEVHIINEFEDDFYGKPLKIALLGYVRPERDYETLEELIEDIKWDIEVAKKSLERPKYLEIKNSSFFSN